MKKYYKSNLTIILSLIMICILNFPLNAQTKLITHDFSKFESINAGNKFDITIVKSDDYSIKAEIDETIHEYIQTYVKDGVLHIGFNVKSLPSNIRKQYRGRNARTPVLKVQVYMSDIQNITLCDDAKLTSSNNYDVDKITFNLSDNSKVTNLDINAGEVNINLSDNAELKLETNSNVINSNMSGSSILNLKYNTKKLSFNSSSRSKISANGYSDLLNIESSSSSNLMLTGETKQLYINGRGSSNIDALNLKTEVANVKLKNSATVTEAAMNEITIDLDGRSTLIFANNPLINILNIDSSTVRPYAADK